MEDKGVADLFHRHTMNGFIPDTDIEFVLRTIQEDMTVIGHGPQISLVHMQQVIHILF